MARIAIAAGRSALAIVEIIVPGNPLYHAGWFNVSIAALMMLLLWRVQGRAIVPAVGVAIVAFGTWASGLLGPMTRPSSLHPVRACKSRAVRSRFLWISAARRCRAG